MSLGYLTDEIEVKRLELLGLKNRELSGDLISVYKYLMGESKKIESGSFLLCLVPGQETTGTS